MKKCPNCNHLVADDNVITCEKCGTYLEQFNSVEIIDEEQVQEENSFGFEPPYDDPDFTNVGMFRRPFSFHGRIRRTEYWLSLILARLYSFVLEFVVLTMFDGDLAVFFIGSIPYFWFMIAQTTKRCHDRGNSGWFQLIPFYGLVLLFGGSDEGDNAYGNSPIG